MKVMVITGSDASVASMDRTPLFKCKSPFWLYGLEEEPSEIKWDIKFSFFLILLEQKNTFPRYSSKEPYFFGHVTKRREPREENLCVTGADGSD